MGDGGWGSETREVLPGVTVLRPLIPPDATPAETLRHQSLVLTGLLHERHCADPILWYYTPAALMFVRPRRNLRRVPA